MITVYTLNLGNAKAGLLDLRAQRINTTGSVLATHTTGYVDLGSGQYLWLLDVPTDASGAMRFYSNAAPTVYYCTLAINARADVAASSDSDSVNAYLYCRNASGELLAGATLSYQIVGADGGYGSGLDNDIHTATTDANGLAQFEAAVGCYYKYWVENGRYKTIHITSETADPYALPSVVG